VGGAARTAILLVAFMIGQVLFVAAAFSVGFRRRAAVTGPEEGTMSREETSAIGSAPPRRRTTPVTRIVGLARDRHARRG